MEKKKFSNKKNILTNSYSEMKAQFRLKCSKVHIVVYLETGLPQPRKDNRVFWLRKDNEIVWPK